MSAFTRQHYEAIAAVLKQQLLDANDERWDSQRRVWVHEVAVERVIDAMADMFAMDNPYFDRIRFGAATGYYVPRDYVARQLEQARRDHTGAAPPSIVVLLALLSQEVSRLRQQLDDVMEVAVQRGQRLDVFDRYQL